MARVDTLDNFLTDVADSIREKKGTTEPILAKNFDTEIKALSGGNSDDFYIDDYYNMFASDHRLNLLQQLLSKCKNVSNVGYMFSGSSSLTDLDLSNFEIANVESLQYMFNYCTGLTNLNISNFDTSKVKNMSYMFCGCSSLENLDISNFDMSTVFNITAMFNNCTKLTNLKFGYNLGYNFVTKTAGYGQYTLRLDYSDLTKESLLDIFNKLYDLNLSYNVAGGNTLYSQKIMIGSKNLLKLDQSEIQIATNKGYTVS